MIESRCGLLCRECPYQEQAGCRGCINIEKPFWGESCQVKSCCETGKHEHCGQCQDFPCSLLEHFAYDAEQGDNGKRIEQCRCWIGKQVITMASSLDFVKYVCDQIGGAGEITYKKMFGEYCIYCNSKVIGVICNNQFFVKKTETGARIYPDCEEAAPYAGAKPHFVINGVDDPNPDKPEKQNIVLTS